MKNFFTLLFVFFLYSASATNYYFSAVSGNDSRTAAQAQHPSTPWKTLSKLNAYFKRLQPGDSVLLKRGETFYGSITVNASGTARSPIVISAHGSGEMPVITGLTKLTNWVPVGNGIYESFNFSLRKKLNIVLLNNTQQPMGRYPDNGYLTVGSHVGKTSITDKELKSAPNWKGAELVLRTSHWTIERCKITRHSGSTIYYTANKGAYEANDDFGYFIQSHIKTLDRLGEWCYDPSTKKVSMYFGSKAPSSYTVEAATISDLISSSRKNYIVFSNITIKGANEKGFDINKGTSLTIKNCTVLFSGTDGVKANAADFKLENSGVLNSNNNGVNVSKTTGAEIRNNIVKNTYTIIGLGQSGNGQGAGIRNGRGGIVEYNQVLNSGYVGVQLGGDYAIVKNNLIDSFCFTKDDGGGIYTSNGPDITNHGRKITGNIVLNGIGAPEGTNTANSSAEGIYMDDNANGVEITGNTIANCHRGIYLHNTRNIVIKNNICYNNTDGQLNMKYDGLGGLLRNHTVTNNIFFSKYAKDVASALLTKKDDNDIRSFGRFDSNYYARPLNNSNLILTTTRLWASSQRKTNNDISEWQSKYKKDAAAKLGLKTIADNPDRYISFAYNATSENKKISLNGNYVDAKNVRYSKSIVLKPYTSAVLIKDGEASAIENKFPTVSITSPVTKATFAARASVTINAVAADSDGDVSKVAFYNGSTLLGTDNTNPYTFTWNNVPAGSYTITAKASDNNAHVTTSAAVLISVVHTAGSVPSVRLTSPAINANYKAPATVYISANASDADGPIKKVEFYSGTTLLHTERNAPYKYTWKKVKAGNYTITAKATDDNDNVTASEPVSISVSASSSSEEKASPEVNITSPQTNAAYNERATILVTADASDTDGAVKKVEFYNGTTLLHTEINAPYTFTWQKVKAGNYTITAKATDNNGNVTTSERVSISVSAPPSSGENKSPEVKITSPQTNAVFDEKATILMTADASDADGSVKKVEFYNGSTLLHTEINAPYTFTWRKVKAGNYTITAKATDNSGNVTTSERVSLSVSARRASHRSAANNDTTVAIGNDTAGVIHSAHTMNLKPQPTANKTEPEIYTLKVFPNPAVNTIQVNVDGLQTSNQKANMTIYTLSGIVVKSWAINLSDKTVEANVTSLKAGMYVITITTNNFKISKKFIKN